MYSTNVYQLTFAILFSLFLVKTTSFPCDAPAPAFPLPNFDNHTPALEQTTKRIVSAIKNLGSLPQYDNTSFSVEVTSQQKSLFEVHHTAKRRSDLYGGGARVIDSSTRYRIASITKPFTVLALLQLQKAGKLSLDDPVLEILPDLGHNQTGSLPWKDITLRALMSQQSGIPRDFAQDDITNSLGHRAVLGLPDIDPQDIDLPSCDEIVNYTRACNETDFLRYVKTIEPLFAPNQHSSYSNINFDLLGLVIAKVTGRSFEDHITNYVLNDLDMNSTTFRQPPDSVAAISRGMEQYWSFYIGVQNPTGGLYSSTSDMSKFLRYVLSTFNAQTPALNWLAPTSYGGSIQTFYGVPWEIFRAKVKDVVPENSGLTSTRPTTFVTKGGGLPGYSSIIIILPDYGLGITILEAGTGQALREIREIVSREMIAFAEKAALDELGSSYAGTFEDRESNSRLVLAHSAAQGLYALNWISNGTDTIAGFHSIYLANGPDLLFHVVPTLLFVDEEKQTGERWRLLPSIGRPKGESKPSIWENFCIGDWDLQHYAGKPFNEAVFWTNDEGRVMEVELTAFRSRLKRVSKDGILEGLSGQQVLAEQPR